MAQERQSIVDLSYKQGSAKMSVYLGSTKKEIIIIKYLSEEKLCYNRWFFFSWNNACYILMMCSHPVCCRHVEQCLLIAVSGRGCMQIPCEFLNVLAMFKTSKLRKTQVCYILYMHRQTLGLCAPTRCRPHYKKKKKKVATSEEHTHSLPQLSMHTDASAPSCTNSTAEQ